MKVKSGSGEVSPESYYVKLCRRFTFKVSQLHGRWRERYISAWIAKTGADPEDVELVTWTENDGDKLRFCCSVRYKKTGVENVVNKTDL